MPTYIESSKWTFSHTVHDMKGNKEMCLLESVLVQYKAYRIQDGLEERILHMCFVFLNGERKIPAQER